MHARFASLIVVVAVLWAPAAHAAEAPASVRMLECAPWEQGIGGSVTYVARMNAVPGTARMALRIRLLEKLGDGKFQRVSAEGLGVWRKSRLGGETFKYEQRVRGLHQGAVYRAVVRYRWFDAEGEPILTARRKSRRCSQLTPLPNLAVASIDIDPGEVKETAVYKVKVVNLGNAPAENVGVLLRVDGEIVDEEVIETLEANGTRTVTFNGPICRDGLRVVVDPRQVIAESREKDNVRDPSCV